jgi:hypothetical protein
MTYDPKRWRQRLAERSDMSSQIVHLTREGELEGIPFDVFDVLMKILKDCRLIGSSTSSGFICGDRTAVCFQDVPLASLCQNVYYEQKYQDLNSSAKLRYRAIGLMFPKAYVYQKGGRPVVYDKTADAKNYLPRTEWWRIVNFDLNTDNIIDWTHEREWRLPGDFDFELAQVTVLLVNESSYRTFVQKCRSYEDKDLLTEIKGIVVLNTILF